MATVGGLDGSEGVGVELVDGGGAGGGELREKQDHDGAEGCHDENDLTVLDEMGLKVLVGEWVEGLRVTYGRPCGDEEAE